MERSSDQRHNSGRNAFQAHPQRAEERAVDLARHRILDVPALLGRDRTPWAGAQPDLLSGEPDRPLAHKPPRHTALRACEEADVRAWLGPRRGGRRELKP
jgi:hypothetical protein